MYSSSASQDKNDLSSCHHLCHGLKITDSVVLWKIQKFDWLIPETK